MDTLTLLVNCKPTFLKFLLQFSRIRIKIKSLFKVNINKFFKIWTILQHIFELLFILHSSVLEKINFRTAVRIAIDYYIKVLVLKVLPTIILSSFPGKLQYTYIFSASDCIRSICSQRFRHVDVDNLRHQNACHTKKYCPQNIQTLTVCILTYTR